MHSSAAPAATPRTSCADGSLPGYLGRGAAQLRATVAAAEHCIAMASRPGGLEALAKQVEVMAAQVASITDVLVLEAAVSPAERALHGPDLAAALRALLGAGEAAQATADEACLLLETRRRARA